MGNRAWWLILVLLLGACSGRSETPASTFTATPEPPPSVADATVQSVDTPEPEECMMSIDEPKYTTGHGLSVWQKSSPEQRQAIELKYKWEKELFKNPIVTGVGIGATRMAIFIDPDAPPEEKAKIPRKLDGCEVDVIEQEKARPAGAVDEKHRPLVGGIQVQPGYGSQGML